MRNSRLCLPAERRNQGFALIISISLMVLLTMLAVGLLSLSAVSLRASSRQQAMAEARANARVALAMAIGELQTQFGPDQRISASAAILGDPDGSGQQSVANPQWVGAWDSWRGENRYIAERHSQSDLVPDLSDHREDSFRSWLVSSAEPSGMDGLDTARSALDAESALVLVGQGTLSQGKSEEAGEVRAPKIPVRGGSNARSGAFAWWVGDESQKATIGAGRDDSDLSKPVEVLAESDSASSVDEQMFSEFAGAIDQAQLRRTSISRKSLDLLPNAKGASNRFHDLTVYSRSVLADVREGGLKRDLNLLAERYDADFTESNGLPVDEDYMLYDLDELHRVPLHDLLVYYSLYKSRPPASRGSMISDGRNKPYVYPISVGEKVANRDGQITNLYRQAVLAKTQLAVWVRAERSSPNPERPYRLKFRFTPIITLWNPYNVPLVLNQTPGEGFRIDILGISADIAVWPNYNSSRNIQSSSLGGVTSGAGDDANSTDRLARLVIPRRVEFAPGEVRVFSLDKVYSTLVSVRELREGYWPISGNEVDYFDVHASRGGADGLAPDSDSMTFTGNQLVGVGFAGGSAETNLKFNQGVAIEARPDYPGSDTGWRSQALYSRRGPDAPDPGTADKLNRFNQLVFDLGSLLDGEKVPHFQHPNIIYSRNPYSVGNLESPEGELVAVFSYGLAGEQEVTSYTFGNQPRFPCRPFLHSLQTANSPWIQDLTTASLYNLGWAWRIEDGAEASNEIVVDGVRGRFGGGWSAATGQDRVVQFELPQRPFFSLSRFSNAALGGWSIARRNYADTNAYGTATRLNRHETTTAHGQGGLFPATSKAIGNSYANPLIPRDQAISTWNTRKYEGAPRTEPLVDHSYLANYALWDEYFMSSIADQSRGLHTSSQFPGQRAFKMAEECFGADAKPLPNQRLKPAPNLSWNSVRPHLFAGPTRPTDDAFEVIARYLMLEGGFNVNSTSVEAWTAVLASLRGKPTLLIDGGSTAMKIETESHAEGETPVSSFSVNTAASIPADSGLRTDSYAPEQWVGSFTLSDEEIRKLAESIVKQVRERGPFLSLSDFVNRRLGSDSAQAKWGALQAAIEDAGLNQQVNAARSADTSRRSEFLRKNGARDSDPIAFPDAARGPVIQGSTAYIDQADILGSIDSQLVPRGDTFVVRACGESYDTSGKVLARAHCEAVVQRMPEYLSDEDEPETRFDELKSDLNRTFGRKLRLVSFRWLSPEEI